MKKNRFIIKAYLFIALIIAISALLLWGIYFFSLEDRVFLLKLLLFSCILFTFFPFFKINIKWILNYFLCIDNSWWDKRIQRPRILIYIVYFGVLYLVVTNFPSNKNDYVLILNRLSLIFYLLIGSFVVGRLIWSKKFETLILPELKNIVSHDIKIMTSDSKVLDSLIDDNKSNIDKSSIEDFKKLLKGEKLDSRIKWVGTSGKNSITYTGIFLVLHSVIEGGEIKFSREKRKALMNFITDNFVKFEEEEIKEISFNTINGAYTNFILPHNTLKR